MEMENQTLELTRHSFRLIFLGVRGRHISLPLVQNQPWGLWCIMLSIRQIYVEPNDIPFLIPFFTILLSQSLVYFASINIPVSIAVCIISDRCLQVTFLR